jgi:hypothetical protein
VLIPDNSSSTLSKQMDERVVHGALVMFSETIIGGAPIDLINGAAFAFSENLISRCSCYNLSRSFDAGPDSEVRMIVRHVRLRM